MVNVLVMEKVGVMVKVHVMVGLTVNELVTVKVGLIVQVDVTVAVGVAVGVKVLVHENVYVSVIVLVHVTVFAWVLPAVAAPVGTVAICVFDGTVVGVCGKVGYEAFLQENAIKTVNNMNKKTAIFFMCSSKIIIGGIISKSGLYFNFIILRPRPAN